MRELSGIAFPGAPYEHVFFVADTQMTGPMVPDELNVYLWRERIPPVLPDARDRSLADRRHRAAGLARARRRDARRRDPVDSPGGGPGLSFQGCSWFSTYRIHHRRAERFRDRRCFLLGDAAHIHSPVGAQGMNTGLQDAYNLGWKLALVVIGQTGAGACSTPTRPSAFRSPSGCSGTTDRAFSLVVSDSRLAGLFRTRILPKMLALAMRLRRVQRKLAFRTISQIGIRTANSPLSETLPGLPDAAPRAGDRFPWLRLKLSPDGPAEDLFGKLDDTRFNLIVIGQPAPPAGLPARATCCASLVDSQRSRQRSGARARARSLGRRSTFCVRTATSGSRGFAWRERRWRGTFPNGSE